MNKENERLDSSHLKSSVQYLILKYQVVDHHAKDPHGREPQETYKGKRRNIDWPEKEVYVNKIH